MRSDKARNIKALKNELLKNPLQTEEQIAEKIGITRQSVNRLKDDMCEIVTNAKNSDIISITDTDKKAIELSQRIIIQSLEKHVEISEAKGGLSLQEALQATGIAKEATARYTIFKGNTTDEDGGLISHEYLQKLQSGELTREDAYEALYKTK